MKPLSVTKSWTHLFPREDMRAFKVTKKVSMKKCWWTHEYRIGAEVTRNVVRFRAHTSFTSHVNGALRSVKVNAPDLGNAESCLQQSPLVDIMSVLNSKKVSKWGISIVLQYGWGVVHW